MAERRSRVGRLALPGVLLGVSILCGCGPRPTGFQPEPGDLLFQDLDLGPLCDAIEAVTQGYRGANLSHCGIVAASPRGRVVVIEAVSSGVRATPLAEFLARSRDAAGRPKVLVGRLRPPDRHLIRPALEEARSLLGRPYDGLFAIDNGRYYCSELIYEIFRQANSGRPVFKLAGMTFKDPTTGATLPAWVSYFRERAVPVPEGKPGINPGGISRSPRIEVVHAYGSPTGWQRRSRPVEPAEPDGLTAGQARR